MNHEYGKGMMADTVSRSILWVSELGKLGSSLPQRCQRMMASG